jgi:hypothetical protein
VHDVPETDHVTPLLAESLLTVAVKFNVWPWSMPVCSDGVKETEIAGGAMVMLRAFVCEHTPSLPPEASVTLTVKLVVPLAVGVPVIAPALLKASPAGSEDPLAKLQLRVPAPPVACRLALYAVPMAPLAKVVVEILGSSETTTAAAFDFVVSATEVACMVTVVFAATVAGAL